MTSWPSEPLTEGDDGGDGEDPQPRDHPIIGCQAGNVRVGGVSTVGSATIRLVLEHPRVRDQQKSDAERGVRHDPVDLPRDGKADASGEKWRPEQTEEPSVRQSGGDLNPEERRNDHRNAKECKDAKPLHDLRKVALAEPPHSEEHRPTEESRKRQVRCDARPE